MGVCACRTDAQGRAEARAATAGATRLLAASPAVAAVWILTHDACGGAGYRAYEPRARRRAHRLEGCARAGDGGAPPVVAAAVSHRGGGRAGVRSNADALKRHFGTTMRTAEATPSPGELSRDRVRDAPWFRGGGGRPLTWSGSARSLRSCACSGVMTIHSRVCRATPLGWKNAVGLDPLFARAGKISTADFRRGLEYLGVHNYHDSSEVRAVAPWRAGGHFPAAPTARRVQIDRIVCTADKSGDGVVDYREGARACARGPVRGCRRRCADAV